MLNFRIDWCITGQLALTRDGPGGGVGWGGGELRRAHERCTSECPLPLYRGFSWSYDVACHATCYASWTHYTGLEQSMKPMIGKPIDQSMTIDALLVNWHRLSSIGVKKISVSHVPACTYTHSQYARMFEVI